MSRIIRRTRDSSCGHTDKTDIKSITSDTTSTLSNRIISKTISSCSKNTLILIIHIESCTTSSNSNTCPILHIEVRLTLSTCSSVRVSLYTSCDLCQAFLSYEEIVADAADAEMSCIVIFSAESYFSNADILLEIYIEAYFAVYTLWCS